MQLTSAAVASASPLTSAEFEQLAQDVLALVQREHAHAEIDIPALTGKQFTPEETAQISDLLGLYFAEVATRAVDAQEAAQEAAQAAARALPAKPMHDWVAAHLRPAA